MAHGGPVKNPLAGAAGRHVQTVDARHAADCGADAVGINFYRKSVRFLTYSEAEIVIRSLPPFTAPVGVFAETDSLTIRETALEHGLRAVQTYALDPDEFDFTPAAHIPAFRVHDWVSIADVLAKVEAYRALGRPPAAVLIDSYVSGEMGGTGHRAPWNLLAGFEPGVPVILAGGLTPENVIEAIRIVRPWGVDVASGVESAPGVKDPGKVTEAYILGTPVEALCGHVFTPSKDPKQLPVCDTCKDIADIRTDGRSGEIGF